jgi:spore cortex formation protein SpoVR/YcgB (stage V sporulation)
MLLELKMSLDLDKGMEAIKELCDFLRIPREEELQSFREFLSYDEVSEIASHDGFPIRFPNWKWDEKFETMPMPSSELSDLPLLIVSKELKK